MIRFIDVRGDLKGQRSRSRHVTSSVWLVFAYKSTNKSRRSAKIGRMVVRVVTVNKLLLFRAICDIAQRFQVERSKVKVTRRINDLGGCSSHQLLEVGHIVAAASLHSLSLCPRPHRAEALSDDARPTSDWHLTYVCLSCTSGLSREKRGLGRPKLAHR